MQLSICVDNFSTEYGILISTLKGCDLGMTTNIINNFADYSELWYPLFIDLLFDLVRTYLKLLEYLCIHFLKIVTAHS